MSLFLFMTPVSSQQLAKRLSRNYTLSNPGPSSIAMAVALPLIIVFGGLLGMIIIMITTRTHRKIDFSKSDKGFVVELNVTLIGRMLPKRKTRGERIRTINSDEIKLKDWSSSENVYLSNPALINVVHANLALRELESD
ncbi:hypothetical protein NEOLI_002162 [Neolecta irregularis DAH-3]|uniref:Uncharacterized protein n=1 Tax=Neolecta irregularis (strain DAH-3) TaxID=1198029 RepID=A0A1U7LSV6_NEOID|nr:hypothetical protein NEOLI_002162 [Neolecta irregularis DAH-3]|eukprot:OLL25709.1 hypothetical protein NEOLI_002162 [Neolecta irregularis DAH-3]